jgi:DNA/RNA-binding domain of Phe-tRNA-synthetase-like protein
VIDIVVAERFAATAVPVRLGCIVASVRPVEAEPELGRLLHEMAAERVAALGEGAPSQVPAIAAARRAYKALGKDPARYRPAAEALLRRAKQGKGIYRVNSVVDVNNVVSLETGISIGAYDIDKLSPPVLFRPGEAGESYEGIGRGDLNLAGLPIFADAEGPFGSPTSDSVRTAITTGTRRLLMVLICFGEPADPSAAVARAAELLHRFAAAEEVETAIVANEAAAA